MQTRQCGWQKLTIAILLFSAVCATRLDAAGVNGLDRIRQDALDFEKNGQWLRAGDLYWQLLRSDPEQAEIRERDQLCLRHIQQLRRHRDPAFRQALSKRKFSEALDVYAEVLAKVHASYVDKRKADMAALFRHGLQELRFALEDRTFLDEYLADADPDSIRAFREQVEQWPVKVSSADDARKQVQALAQTALQDLGVNPSAIILEFVCGACSALDEYTFWLPPTQFADVQASLKGGQAGVGIEVELMDQVVVISKIYPNSPAAGRELKVGDRLTHIDRKPVAGLSLETIESRLHGEAGSAVELTLLPLSEMASRSVKLERQQIVIPTVEDVQLLQEGIGYFKLSGFQAATVQEMRDAILQLQTQGMRVLVLDLRGNPGGLLKAAIQAARIFLSEGIIVFTQSRLPDFNATHKAHNPDAVTVPLVVLIDAETASAAEVLAGALKDNRRATLVGQTTYGKGTIQCVVPLESIPAGIRITVARLISPANQAYNGRGVSPSNGMEIAERDAQLNAALQEALQLAMMMR